MGYTHNYRYCLGKENADFGMNIFEFEKLRLQANHLANKIAVEPPAHVKPILDALDSYRDFLKQGNVFNDNLIDAYISLKMDEVLQFEHHPHPVEFKMYYSV